ncbi:MAG TPA: DUF3048 domain-containing protein [Candidatus Solibacter sp.]|nr:DUF3048 domain-containing protein [Candidatus Solibacter sp.]
MPSLTTSASGRRWHRHPTLLAPLTIALLLTGCTSSQAAKPRAHPSPSPSPKASPLAGPSETAPDPFGPPLPAPQGGPLPGQGLPVSAPLANPLLIQIENTAPSRPQAGLEAASVIFQSLAESSITRLSVLYHRVPGVVGPVRSARFVTVYLAQRFGTEVMCSGTSGHTLDRLIGGHVPVYINDFDNGNHFFRWSGRPAPHNVYTGQSQMINASLGGGASARSTDLFRSDDWAGTDPAPMVDVPAHRTTFSYRSGAYDVVTEGSLLTDVIYGTVRPISVAVLHVPQFEVPSIVDVAGTPVKDYNLSGTGTAEMYANGTVIHGNWSTIGTYGPITLRDATGNPVGMPRGLLWVSLAP